jgi:hypothetical protein
VTWSKGGVGSIGKPILSHLQEYVREMVDIFIKAYLAENPKYSSWRSFILPGN